MKKGFTLIELLVVIAIIGILAGIVLTSLSSARNKAKDAKIISQLNQMKSAAEMYYITNGNFGALTSGPNYCATAGSLFVDSGMSKLINNTPGAACGSYSTTGSTFADEWAVFAPFASDTKNGWCVDYKGVSCKTEIVHADGGVLVSTPRCSCL